jgi:membrane-bound lytic murein transglycosylase B
MAAARRLRCARVLVAAGLALATLIPSLPAGATTSDEDVAAARREASSAALQVQLLAAEYRLRSHAAAQAVARLQASFAGSSQAESDVSELALNVRRAQARRNRTVRALVAGGGPATLIASVLLADSPDEALWRVSTSQQVFSTVLDDQTAGIEAGREAAAEASAREESLEAADGDRARALADAQQESALAAAALDRARATLARLSAQARRLRQAQEAERALAAAVAAARLGPESLSPAAMDIPAEFAADYHAASHTCTGLRWTLLAAVGQVESGHGRNNGPSSAGAIGPMQFMPATFARYAVDGDGDGVTDAWDPEDAIFTAARYLCASGIAAGGASGVHDALLAYNHAEWYVALVLAVEQAIIAAQHHEPPATGKRR